MFPGMEKMLRGIDAKLAEQREQHMSTVIGAATKGVQLVADNRIRDGSFAILVSPGDFARLKEYRQ